MCFGCSKEPSHRDGSFEYPQHMIWLRNKKNNFQLRTLKWGLNEPAIVHCAEDILDVTFDFQQYGILTRVGSVEPMQSPFKLRNFK